MQSIKEACEEESQAGVVGWQYPPPAPPEPADSEESQRSHLGRAVSDDDEDVVAATVGTGEAPPPTHNSPEKVVNKVRHLYIDS